MLSPGGRVSSGSGSAKIKDQPSANQYPENESIKKVIGSMDAVSLFTRLEAEKSSEILKEEVMRSEVEFEDIDEEELGK